MMPSSHALPTKPMSSYNVQYRLAMLLAGHITQENVVNSLTKKTLFTAALITLTACVSYPQQQSYYPNYSYRSGYVVERDYYSRPAYGNRYIIRRNYYGYGGTPYHYQPYSAQNFNFGFYANPPNYHRPYHEREFHPNFQPQDGHREHHYDSHAHGGHRRHGHDD